MIDSIVMKLYAAHQWTHTALADKLYTLTDIPLVGRVNDIFHSVHPKPEHGLPFESTLGNIAALTVQTAVEGLLVGTATIIRYMPPGPHGPSHGGEVFSGAYQYVAEKLNLVWTTLFGNNSED